MTKPSNPPSEPVIRAEGIGKTYRSGREELVVLRDINLAISTGEFVTVVGPSGVGKSTLLHILGALDHATTGTVRIGESVLNGLQDRQLAAIRNRRIGFVFQFHHLLPEFSALENVMMPAMIGGRPRAEVQPRAEFLLEEVGLRARMLHRPNELSGGEQQRVAVARALMNQPAIILADEPSGNLDRQSAESLHSLLIRLCEETGQTFVIVTHNEHLAEHSWRTLKMFDGTITEDIVRTA